jgi:hypothetical protein
MAELGIAQSIQQAVKDDSLAQLAEHRIPDPKVVGSSPAWVIFAKQNFIVFFTAEFSRSVWEVA